MQARITYKRDLSHAAGAAAAQRWTEEVAIDDFVPELQRLMIDAERSGATISQVIILRPEFAA